MAVAANDDGLAQLESRQIENLCTNEEDVIAREAESAVRDLNRTKPCDYVLVVFERHSRDVLPQSTKRHSISRVQRR